MTPFDPKKPVATRDGRQAFIDATDAKFPTGQTLLGRIRGVDGDDMISKWFSDGRSSLDGDTNDDLFNVPSLESRWLNIYTENAAQSIVTVTREQADSIAGRDRIGIMELIFQDRRLVDHVYTEV